MQGLEAVQEELRTLQHTHAEQQLEAKGRVERIKTLEQENRVMEENALVWPRRCFLLIRQQR